MKIALPGPQGAAGLCLSEHCEIRGIITGIGSLEISKNPTQIRDTASSPFHRDKKHFMPHAFSKLLPKFLRASIRIRLLQNIDIVRLFTSLNNVSDWVKARSPFGMARRPAIFLARYLL